MRNIESSNWLKNPLLTLIQADSKEEKQGEKNNDRMIGFNLQAIETVDAQANLNKLLKEDKAQVDTNAPKNTTNSK
jgi:hypothetical protein